MRARSWADTRCSYSVPRPSPPGSRDRLQKITEPAGMRFLRLRQRFEPVCDFREALIARGLCHSGIHVRIFVRFPMNGGLEVECRIAEWLACGGIANLLEIVEETMSMAGFAFGGIAEVAGNLRVSFHVCNLCEIEISAIRHRLAGEGIFQILMSFASFQVRHVRSPFLMMI